MKSTNVDDESFCFFTVSQNAKFYSSKTFFDAFFVVPGDATRSNKTFRHWKECSVIVVVLYVWSASSHSRSHHHNSQSTIACINSRAHAFAIDEFARMTVDTKQLKTMEKCNLSLPSGKWQMWTNFQITSWWQHNEWVDTRHSNAMQKKREENTIL